MTSRSTLPRTRTFVWMRPSRLVTSRTLVKTRAKPDLDGPNIAGSWVSWIVILPEYGNHGCCHFLSWRDFAVLRETHLTSFEP